MELDLSKLKAPFLPEDLEWRIQSSGIRGDKPWGKCLTYVTARAIEDRLDEVCGVGGWKNMFQEGPDGGVLCGISIKIDGEWVTKFNGAENTAIEKVKGGLSGATKRTGSTWGIGRYLYKIPVSWACFHNKGVYSANVKKDKNDKTGKFFKWDAPELPQWALPKSKEPPKKKTNSTPPASSKEEKTYPI